MTFPSFKKKVREGLGFKTAKTDREIFKVLDSRFANDRYFLPNVWKEYSYPKVHAWYEKKKFSDVKSEMEKGIINPIHWEQL